MGHFGLFFLGSEDKENIMSVSKKYGVPYEEVEKAYKEMLEKLGVKVKTKEE